VIDPLGEHSFGHVADLDEGLDVLGLVAGRERFAVTIQPGRGDPSVVTSKPAIGGRVKTGQWTASGTKLFYPADSLSGKPVLVRQLRGPHFST
jgi:hypothetical protein